VADQGIQQQPPRATSRQTPQSASPAPQRSCQQKARPRGNSQPGYCPHAGNSGPPIRSNPGCTVLSSPNILESKGQPQYGCAKYQAINAVQQPPVAWQQGSGVLQIGPTFECRLHKVSDLASHRNQSCEEHDRS